MSGLAEARPHRLEAKDTTLSRWRHGFESRWGCSTKGQVKRPFGDRAVSAMAAGLADRPFATGAARQNERARIDRARIAEALVSYYGAGSNLYRASICGRAPPTLGVLTDARWLDLAVPMDSHHERFLLDYTSQPPPIELTATATEAAISRLLDRGGRHGLPRQRLVPPAQCRHRPHSPVCRARSHQLRLVRPHRRSPRNRAPRCRRRHRRPPRDAASASERLPPD